MYITNINDYVNLKRKYNEATLDKLEDFYPAVVDESKNYDENMVYDFFFKMYNLFVTYREKYNVNLDLLKEYNDIKELIDALGGKKKSILSYAGFGDILMTYTSPNSRNFSFGYLIGKGAKQNEIDEYLENTTVEGMYTLKSIHKLVRKKKVKMPIINLIHDIIIGKKDKEELLQEVFIVSGVEVNEANEFSVEVAVADGEKCERCWMYSTTIGEYKENPTICHKCSESLK